MLLLKCYQQISIYINLGLIFVVLAIISFSYDNFAVTTVIDEIWEDGMCLTKVLFLQ